MQSAIKRFIKKLFDNLKHQEHKFKNIPNPVAEYDKDLLKNRETKNTYRLSDTDKEILFKALDEWHEETKEEDSVVADDEDVEEVANEEGDESDESVALDENNNEEEKEETKEGDGEDSDCIELGKIKIIQSSALTLMLPWFLY